VIFKPDMKLVGVDIDKVISEDRKFTRTDKEEEVTKFIEESDTYIEVSPSGTGFHAFFEINDPFGNEEDDNYPILHGNKKEPYEVYSAGRFFTFTGNTINNKEVRQVTKEQLDNILATIRYPFKTVETEEEKEIKKAKITKGNKRT
jgi:putative DNA primase/helicase